jgi:hypothetical protein
MGDLVFPSRHYQCRSSSIPTSATYRRPPLKSSNPLQIDGARSGKVLDLMDIDEVWRRVRLVALSALGRRLWAREKGKKNEDRWHQGPTIMWRTRQQNHSSKRPMIKSEQFPEFDGQKRYPILQLNSQKRTEAMIGWLKMNFTLEILTSIISVLQICTDKDAGKIIVTSTALRKQVFRPHGKLAGLCPLVIIFP